MPRELRQADVDEDVLLWLERRAALHGRRVKDEIRSAVEAAGARSDPALKSQLREALEAQIVSVGRAADFEQRAAALRRSMSGRRHTPAEVLLREGRDER